MKKKVKMQAYTDWEFPSKLTLFVSALLFILFFLVYRLFAAVYIQYFEQAKSSESILLASKKNKNILTEKHIPTPSITLTPTSSPKPTQEIIDPNAFCLNVPVIYYHHIEPVSQAAKEGHAQLTVDSQNFDEQMKYLADHGYNTISAEDLVNALLSHKPLPGKPIVVTADDGYTDIYQYAYPIIKKYNIKLSLMIPTGLLENPDYLTWNQLKEMVDSGFVYAYDHTWSHYSLPHGGDAKDQMEISVAKTQLEEHLGHKVKIFAYPYGTYDPRIMNLLRSDGFTGAYSTIPGTRQCDSYIFLLRRIRVGGSSLSYYGIY